MYADARPLPMPKEEAGAPSPALRAWQSAIQLLREEHPDAYAVASRRVLSMMQDAVGDPLLVAMRATDALSRLADALGMHSSDPDAVVETAVARLAPSAGRASAEVVPIRAGASLSVVALAEELAIDAAEVQAALMLHGVMATARDWLSPHVAALIREQFARRQERDRSLQPLPVDEPTDSSDGAARERMAGELIVLASVHQVTITVSEINALSTAELKRRIDALQQPTEEVA